MQSELTLALIIVFLAGLFVGGQLNRGIYRLAFKARRIGPWSPPPDKAPPRLWTDRLPVIGWWGLRRESPLHGRGYWIRPMLIELGFAAGAAALYWWEMSLGLYPSAPSPSAPTWMTLHSQYLAHLTLIALMTAATFIDFDEQTIPDSVTIPGALLGLALAAAAPVCRLPVVATVWQGSLPIYHLDFLHLGSPEVWPGELDGVRGLALGLAVFALWCLALLPGLWTTRRGYRKAVAWWLASVVRNRMSYLLFGLIPLGWAAIALVWHFGGASWESLLSALFGLAFGGALVWAVRIIAGSALGQEAMGFGDVTLLAMIGAYVGWQSALMIFFMAPFFGVLVAVAQFLLTGRRDIAYGPYLCLAAVFLIITWASLWEWAENIFSLGWMLILILAFCLALMGMMLLAMQGVKRVIGR